MTIAYCTYFHRDRIPQVQCLIASIRRFDTESEIIAVVEDECLTECKFALQGGICLLRMSYADQQCRILGLDWGSVRGARSERDTAWTFQACYPYWILTQDDETRRSCDSIVYVDSDCFFFQDLRPYIERLPETAHVALCPHHYPTGRENVSAGKFNNGLMLWRNSDKAREIAKAWGLEAIAKWEPHEQILLDTWPARYGDAVAEFPRAVDVGPWQLAKIVQMRGQPMIDYGLTLGPLQSYHFHELRLNESGRNPVVLKNGRQANLTNYPINEATLESVYEPYLRELEKYA